MSGKYDRIIIRKEKESLLQKCLKINFLNISGTKKLKLTVEKNNSFEIRKFSQRNEYDRGMRWKRDRREIRGN